jgi:ATP-dependent Lon protease
MTMNDSFIFTNVESDEALDFMPMIPMVEDDDTAKNDFASELPIMPLKNTVLYPGVVIPITVGRDKSIAALQEANKTNKLLAVLAQKEDTADATIDQLHSIGTVAKILKLLKMPDGTTTVILQGRNRVRVTEFISDDPFLKAKIELLSEETIAAKTDEEFDATVSNLKDQAIIFAKLSQNIPQEAGMIIRNIDNPAFLLHFVASNLNLPVPDKQSILQTDSLKERVKMVLKYINHEIQLLELKNQIQNKTRQDLDKQQREYFLNQQLKTIQEELGFDDNKKDLSNLKERGAKKQFTEDAKKLFNRELDKLNRMHPASAEYSVAYNYVETLLDLPWNEFTKDNFELKHAEETLHDDHYGLDKIKKRILEYLAVLKLKGDMKSPILCFVGPPGVGKTSLGKSIAKALDRKFVRISLGGVHDEAEIRGHRKTYIGAMPGRIVQSLKKVQSSNPVFILDEIDKIGQDHRSDPSSALLEVLDPEQNSHFYDNFLELEFDLSKILFIATANSLQTIQPALRDRMEIIEVSGYSLEEKMEIAKKYLITKQREAHGLKSSQIKISNAALQILIDGYTRESGVRELDRQIAALMRNTAKSVATDESYDTNITVEKVQDVLGKIRYDREMFKEQNPPGVAVGLAWTSVGGELLYIEAIKYEGKEGLKLSGQLGDVMKESAQAAFTFIKSNAKKLNIDSSVFEKETIHIHVPEGATPKDGPSAGITMLTAITSLLTNRKVKPLLAMSGEITLRGKVLPVGGIKEKILAAKRAGMKEIILCKMNRKDVEEINQDFLGNLQFHYVDRMTDVLDIALV